MTRSSRRWQVVIRTALGLALFGLFYLSMAGADQIKVSASPSGGNMSSLRAQPAPSPEEHHADPSASPGPHDHQVDPAASPGPVASPGPDDHHDDHHDDLHRDPAASPEPAGSPVSRP